jgi:hypothetical protein
MEDLPDVTGDADALRADPKEEKLPWSSPVLSELTVAEGTAAGCTPCPDSGCATARS